MSSRGRGFSKFLHDPSATANVDSNSNITQSEDDHDLISWEDAQSPAPISVRHTKDMAAVSSAGRGSARKRDNDEAWRTERKLGESEQEWESRLAVEELDRYFRGELPSTSREKQRLKDEQIKAIRAIRTNIMFPENYVSRNKTPSPERSITPPGPPTSRIAEPVIEIASLEQGRNVLPVITRGVLFGGLKLIPTDPELDPPPGSCISCWQFGHRRNDCPNPQYGYCRNCGRRGVTMTDCPRCSDRHKRDMMMKYGREKYQYFRSERIKKTKGIMANSGKISVEEKLRLEAEQKQNNQASASGVASESKENQNTVKLCSIGRGRGRRVSETIEAMRPGPSVVTTPTTSERKEITVESTLSVDEIWEMIQQAPTYKSTKPLAVGDVTVPPPNWTIPEPAISPPIVYQSTLPLAVCDVTVPPPNWTILEPAISPPIVYQSTPPLALPPAPPMMDNTDRFIEQTRAMAQALAGLPAEAVTLAMKEFYEERRKSDGGRLQ
ncbi:uncharacterized protein LOC122510492 [Leptopilina heterotoma]|uniref:uncharacterized protein LOC122510492 n=1 Tax=Leptopilina heterotoma TaxID=63436 RepID=UPI001CA8A098|nr:uncharacterized protein LOC122510492 [Leptopilina heterotoma]